MVLSPSLLLCFSFFWGGDGGWERKRRPPFSPHAIPGLPLFPASPTPDVFSSQEVESLLGGGRGRIVKHLRKNGGKNKCFNESVMGEMQLLGCVWGGQSLIVGKGGGERPANSSTSFSEARPIGSFFFLKI